MVSHKTPIDALNKFGCFRLAARISDLRNDGMLIKTKIISTKKVQILRLIRLFNVISLQDVGYPS